MPSFPVALRAWFLLAAIVAAPLGCSALVDNALSDKPAEGAGGAPVTASSTSSSGSSSTSSSSGTMSSSSSSSSGGGGDAGPCSDANCPTPKGCCNGVCVDLANDPKNCTKCGNECPGTTCGGTPQCTNVCQLGYANCDGNLINGCEVYVGSDSKHCGSCDVACSMDMTCVGGACTCPAGRLNCDSDPKNGCEVDPSTDAANCGGCGKQCGANQACVAGLCECTAGFDDCNKKPADGCEASLLSVSDCTACNKACAANMVCGAGGCACAPGFLDCDAMPANGCEASASAPTSCGLCTTKCTGGTPLCNAGGCVASCGPGLTQCPGACADLQSDPSNCGACGAAVAANQQCVAGKIVCTAGFGDCGGGPGCETPVTNDPANCGACNVACKAGAVCVGGACQCAVATPNDCGVACQACCAPADCADGNGCTLDSCMGGVCSNVDCGGATPHCCGNLACFECCGLGDCPGGKTCSGNKCIDACVAPAVACMGNCVDITMDAANCGACGNVCGNGRSCTSSTCGPAWVSLASAGQPSARARAAVTWANGVMAVWGGTNGSSDFADGANYDPAADAWQAMAAGPLSARASATAVWTGSNVVIWGGATLPNGKVVATGARYAKATNSWAPISAVGAPVGRAEAIGVWTGLRVLLWGGHGKNNLVAGGALYDDTLDAWTPISTAGAPSLRSGVAYAWSGTELLLFGGQIAGTGATAEGHAYNPATDMWRTLASSGAPAARYDAMGAWTGSAFAVWGGRNAGAAVLQNGALYDPVADKWTAMSSGGAPAARSATAFRQGWAAYSGSAGRVLFDGGMDGNGGFLTAGSLFDPVANAWTASIPSWPSGKDHEYGAEVWTGNELILWSGMSAGVVTPGGERFKP